MPTLAAPNVPLSQVGRAAHDLGLASLLGGQLYGRYALHPAVEEVSDARERGRVVNRAWSRYGVVQTVSLAAVVSGWLGARAAEARPRRLSAPEKRLALAKDILVGASAVSGLATAAELPPPARAPVPADRRVASRGWSCPPTSATSSSARTSRTSRR